jgi:hypothetical protein
LLPGVPPSGFAGCAPRLVPSRGHSTLISDAFVQVLDHVIIAGDATASFTERGLL